MKKEKNKNKDIMNNKTKQKINNILGDFIYCGKPFTENNEVSAFLPSFVKLNQIKSIHMRNDKSCIFYTYKDEWYICNLSIKHLVEAININLRISHGCEDTRDNSGGTDLPKNKENIF